MCSNGVYYGLFNWVFGYHLRESMDIGNAEYRQHFYNEYTPRGRRYLRHVASRSCPDIGVWPTPIRRCGDGFSEKKNKLHDVAPQLLGNPESDFLNPGFARWLMGFPSGWCDSVLSSATQRRVGTTKVYYNEYDKSAARWLRNLIADGFLPDGDVDDRDIRTVTPADLRGYAQCHFFAGIGGWALALRNLGIPDDFPIWTGSLPCQPFSCAGKGAGFSDKRHLWPVFAELIQKCAPVAVVGEQSADAINHGWLDEVIHDLIRNRYSCVSSIIGAHSVGAPHKRRRLYWGAFQKSFESLRKQVPVATKQIGSAWNNSRMIMCADHKLRRIPNDPRDFPITNGKTANFKPLLHGYGNAICVPAAEEFVAALWNTHPDMQLATEAVQADVDYWESTYDQEPWNSASIRQVRRKFMTRR